MTNDVGSSCLCVPPHSEWTATHSPFQAGVPWKYIDCLWIPCLFSQTLLWVLPQNVSVTIQGWTETRNWRSLALLIPFAGSHHVLQALFYACLLCLRLLTFVMTVLSSVLSYLIQQSRGMASIRNMASIHRRMLSTLAQHETQWDMVIMVITNILKVSLWSRYSCELKIIWDSISLQSEWL